MRDGIKVGELARRTGVSVRALHHYDEIGLLSPAGRTRSGHRRYTAAEVRRLQQIVSLRQLGFTLAEVRNCLDGPDFPLQRVLEMHVARLDEQIRAGRAARDRLAAILATLRSAGDVSADELIQAIEVTTMNKYYTPEQLEYLRQRRGTVGEQRMREVEQEWRELFEAFREAMDAGLDVTADAVRPLARKARSLIDEFTGGDAGIEQSLGAMYRAEGAAPLQRHGFTVDPAVFRYMGRAMGAPG